VDPEWVEFVKESEGIPVISENHQKVIDFLQDYYKKNGIAPMVRILSKVTGYKLKNLRAVPLRPRQRRLQNGRPAQAHRLRVIIAPILIAKGRELRFPPFFAARLRPALPGRAARAARVTPQ